MRTFFGEYVNPYYGYFFSLTELLHETQTTFQHLQVYQTEGFGRVLLLDGITQVWELREFQYHEPMVHPALASHPNPKRVCVIGGGDGGINREVLRHPIDHLDHCELDEGVVNAVRQWMPGIPGGCFEDPRCHLHIKDGRKFIEAAEPESYDAIIMDMTDPVGPSRMLYTVEYFQAVQRAIGGAHGRFVMHCESPVSRPKTYQQILNTLGQVFNHLSVFYVYIQMYGVLWAVVVASNDDEPLAIEPDTIRTRLAERAITDLQHYSPNMHRAMLGEPPWITRLREAAGDFRPITDAQPDFEEDVSIQVVADKLVIREAAADEKA